MLDSKKLISEGSRRGFLVAAAGGVAAALSIKGAAAAGAVAQQDPLPESTGSQKYVERLVQRGDYKIYAREYPGRGPTFVLLHGFPDNLRIYDDLAPRLASGGRHVVAFDFLGFGNSAKPVDYPYDFEQQKNDLATVCDALKLDHIIPVAHDAGGSAAINFAVSQPARIESMVLLNTFYAGSTTLRFPELVALCADPTLGELAIAILGDPEKLKWLLAFQNKQFQTNATPAQRERFDEVLRPIIDANFAATPTQNPAFMRLAADLHRTIASNGRQLAKLGKFQKPVRFIWGAEDPYLNKEVAQDLAGAFPSANLELLPLGHWPQIDDAAEVARKILG